MKQYIKPQTDIVDVNMEYALLAGSNGVTLDSTGDVESVGIGGDFDGGTVKSRGASLWDDED